MDVRFFVDEDIGKPHIYRHGVTDRFPPGWDEDRVRRVLEHYEDQTDEEAMAEDEAAYSHDGRTMIEVPSELLPAVRELISRSRKE